MRTSTKWSGCRPYIICSSRLFLIRLIWRPFRARRPGGVAPRVETRLKPGAESLLSFRDEETSKEAYLSAIPSVRLSILGKESDVCCFDLTDTRFIGVVYFCQRILTALLWNGESTVLCKLNSLRMSQKPEVACRPQTAWPHNGGIEVLNFTIHRTN